MSSNAGIIVSWEKDGNVYTGVAFYRKQSANLGPRLLINLLNPDGTFSEDGNGKHVVILKQRASVKTIGYQD